MSAQSHVVAVSSYHGAAYGSGCIAVDCDLQ